MSESINVDDVSRLLAVLVAEQGSYTYVDKLGYAPSADLAVFYLKEALRDYHSLLRKGVFDNPVVRDVVSGLNKKLDKINYVLGKIAEIRDRRELRRITSLISSKALAYAARYMGREVEEEGE